MGAELIEMEQLGTTRRGATSAEIAEMPFNWVAERGNEVTFFGPLTPQVQDMKSLPVVAKHRTAFLEKNRERHNNRQPMVPALCRKFSDGHLTEQQRSYVFGHSFKRDHHDIVSCGIWPVLVPRHRAWLRQHDSVLLVD